jgi:hypothetical protein|tara:strand:- start:48 stop:212 length:165 start_codon:yes stop_codon:yes gene_type:complete
MGKIKQLLEEGMMNNPEEYSGFEDHEFWMQCRKEELLERIYSRIYYSKITKNGS